MATSKGEGIWGFPLWRRKNPHWNYNRISFWDTLPGDLHLLPPSPQTYFISYEDFFFDKEKNSWLSSEVATSFSLCQRGNPHRLNFLVWAEGRGKGYEDLLFDEVKNLIDFNRILFWDILPCDLHIPPPFSHEDFFLVRISSLTKRKTHCPPPPPPRHSQEAFSLVRISSLTKRKTHGCP